MTSKLVPGWPWHVKNGVVFHGGQALKAADPARFQPLSDHWGRDDKTVFGSGSVLRTADAGSFVVLNELFAKDAQSVFTIKGPVKDADAETFCAVGASRHPFYAANGYAKDKNHVYHATEGGKASVINNVDPESFVSHGRGWGGDRSAIYWQRFRLAGATPPEWRAVGGPHTVSGKHAYYLNKKIKGADGRSLETLPILDLFHGMWSRDGSGYFQFDQPAEPRIYLDVLRKCFIFRGRVSEVLLTCDEKKHVLPIQQAQSWRVAEHCWISVVATEWLQKPDIAVSNLPILGEPFRFGEGLRLELLFPLTWMETRTWIFLPTEDRSRLNQPLCLSSINYWWEDFPLDWLQHLIEAANS